jgi:hypothetical protein
MKDVPKKQLPEVSGGQLIDGPCIPDPFNGPFITDPDYPQEPGGPHIDLPAPYVDQSYT